jgi:anti-sigma factor ChrR (cupin superfamily)
MEQSFNDADGQSFSDLEVFPGASMVPLAEPVPEGSIHRLRMKKGTVIPVHEHPASEYVYVLEGTLRTGGRSCEKGCFWTTPGGVRQGPHEALTDVELLTIRLGPMGAFDSKVCN